MAMQNWNNVAVASWEAAAIFRMAALAFLEVLWGLLRWPFVRTTEDVQLTYIKSERNQELLAGCPSIKTFSCCPWAVGPHAQTFFSVIKLGVRPVPRKEFVTMPDGVQITLLWFEPKSASEDVPLVITLHGIGGDENSVRPIVLAEECLRRGWRSVLYVRRGHGDSSLLPVGTGPPQTAALETKVTAALVTPRADAVRGDSVITPAVEAAEVVHDGSGGGGKEKGRDITVDIDSMASSAAVAAVEAPAINQSSPPMKPSAVTTVTVIATDGGDGDASECDDASSACTESFATRCLPKRFCPLRQSDNGDTVIAAANTASTTVDLHDLRRTRKAFPQHADTEDFQVVLQHIRAARPQALMVAVGFSMGSNVLVKFLGEHPPAAQPDITSPPTTAADAETRKAAELEELGPSQSPRSPGARRWLDEDPKNPLAAAVSVSNGYDIIQGTRHLVSCRPLADRILTGALHKLLRRRLSEVHAICAAHGLLVDFDEVLSCNTIREFESALMLPICGLTDVDEYYRHNNCLDAMMNVRTPLLCLSARDDPVIDPLLIRHAEAAAAVNPYVLLGVTERGGHLGWLQGWSGRSWMMDVIMQFVESVGDSARMKATGSTAGSTNGEQLNPINKFPGSVPMKELRAVQMEAVSAGLRGCEGRGVIGVAVGAVAAGGNEAVQLLGSSSGGEAGIQKIIDVAVVVEASSQQQSLVAGASAVVEAAGGVASGDVVLRVGGGEGR